MPLAERDAKTDGAESNVGEREDAIESGLEAQIVGDAFHLGVRLRAVHDAEEIGNLIRAAGLSLVPADLR
jgi:Xaa-Pro aminopeptidase